MLRSLDWCECAPGWLICPQAESSSSRDTRVVKRVFVIPLFLFWKRQSGSQAAQRGHRVCIMVTPSLSSSSHMAFLQSTRCSLLSRCALFLVYCDSLIIHESLLQRFKPTSGTCGR